MKKAFVYSLKHSLPIFVSFVPVGLVGSLISFPTAGMDFALTALFIVIVAGQLEASDSPVPAIVAAASSIVCLLVLGPAYFILPSLAVTVTVGLHLRKKNSLISILGGTVCCMIVTQMMV